MVLPLLFVAVSKQTMVQPFMLFPDIHGDQVVFTSEGDLWVGNLKSGESRRLTSDAGIERNASFSPDGKQIAFEGEYDGQRQAYVIPTAGGTPKKLTSIENFRAVTGWTPDGSSVLFRYFTPPMPYIYATVPATGGAITKLPMEFSSHVSFTTSKDRYVFTRFSRWNTAWFRYIGGMQNQVWLHEPSKGSGDKEFRQITDVEGTNEYPVYCAGRVYFANENKAKFSLMSVPEGGGKARKELESEFEIRELSSDGTRVIFQNGRDVNIFDPATSKTSKLDLTLNSDLIHARPQLAPVEKYIQSVSITPTGKRVLVESRGQIISAPIGEGEARVVLAKNGVRYRHPSMSNDAKKIAYVDDSTGENQVYVANVDGSSPVQLTKNISGQIWGTRFSPDGKWVGFTDSEMKIRIVNVDTKEDKTVAVIAGLFFAAPFEFSPDSKWVAYSSVAPVTSNNIVELYDISTGKATKVTDGRASDSLPAFSADGKYLAYVSNRNLKVANDPILNQLNLLPTSVLCLTPLQADGEDPLAPKDTDESDKKEEEKKPNFQIDFDGIFERRIELPIPPAQIGKVAISGNRVIYATDSAIRFFDLATKANGDISPGTTFTLSGDGKTLLLTEPSPAAIGVNGEPRKATTFGGLKLHIEPQDEWKQIYWDAWRHLRDYFYVSNMNGVDWKAIGDKYAAYLPSVRAREELDELIRWMQAELGSSHQYLATGDRQDIKTRVGGAYLGIDLSPDPSGTYRIDKILKGDGFVNSERSPLLGAGKNIKEGMFLLAIGGEKLSIDADPFEKLAGRAGQTISVTVNTKPTMEGAKTYFVKPVPSEARMRYLTWVEANRQYVNQRSGGKLGYLHLQAMTNQDMQDFVRQYFYQRDKEGFIIDGRFNNGGYIQDMVNRILNESLTGFFNLRNSPLPWTRQQDFFTGPMVTLINEFDISCGEEFPHRFRDLKRGPLIGRRTMGGEVGSDPGWPLADGGTVSVPAYGMFTPDGKWAIEGLGVSPDIDVQSDPNAYINGRDTQVDKAIEWLLAELKRNPPKKMIEPKSRDRVKNPDN